MHINIIGKFVKKFLSLFIGLRYVRAKRRDQFISIISVISMLGIIVGVWAIITVMSVMNGFHNELKGRILYAAAHVTISEQNNQLSNWQSLSESVKQHSSVLETAPFIIGQGMLANGRHVTGALIRGVDVDLESKVTPVLDHVIEGNKNLLAGEFNIILGNVLAAKIGVSVGDKVTLVAPKGRVTPAGLLPRLKRFTVTGLFSIDMYDYDSGIALINIDDAATFLGMKGQVSGLRLKLEEAENARLVRYDLIETLTSNFWVRDWTSQHANFFSALEIEKRVVRIVLFLIVLVAAFNIISTLVMMVTDKQADVAILRTLGMSPRGIMKIFIVQGLFIGVIGTFIGGMLGVFTALNIADWIPAIESFFKIQFFPSNVYVISHFPAELRWNDVFWTMAVSVLISFLATLYPSKKAAQVEPAEALRYE